MLPKRTKIISQLFLRALKQSLFRASFLQIVFICAPGYFYHFQYSYALSLIIYWFPSSFYQFRQSFPLRKSTGYVFFISILCNQNSLTMSSVPSRVVIYTKSYVQHHLPWPKSRPKAAFFHT